MNSFMTTMAHTIVFLGVTRLAVVLAVCLPFTGLCTGQQWQEGFAGDTLWKNAVTSGFQQNMLNQDDTKEAYYIGRLYSQNSIIPCKIEMSKDSKAGSAWCIDGDGSAVDDVGTYQVLVADPNDISWQPATNGDVPGKAKPTGVMSSGELIYTCRVLDTNKFGLLSGTLRPSSKACKINFLGTENIYSTYEVLVVLR